MRMLRAVFALALLWPIVSFAQTAKNKTTLQSEITSQFPDNTSGAITPQILRNVTGDFVASWQQAPTVNPQAGTVYAIQSSDYGKLVTFSNVGAIAVSLSAANTLSPFNFYALNKGAGNVTFTPSGSTINGLSTYGLATGQGAWVVSDGTNYQVWTNTVRTALAGNATYFVNPSTGNDTTGTGTSGSPWQTVLKAWNYVQQNIDMAGFAATVQLQASSTGVATTLSGQLVGQIGPQSFAIQGNCGSIDTVVVSSSSAGAILFQASNNAQFTVQCLKLSSTGTGFARDLVSVGGEIDFTNVDFGATTYAQLDAAGNTSVIRSTGAYTISGGGTAHAVVEDNALIWLNFPVTLVGTPAFTIFVQADLGGMIDGTNFSIASGTATGKRYVATVGGIVYGGGSAGPNLYPGNSPGTADATSVYDVSALLNTFTNSIPNDITLSNTANYFDGPSVAQGAGGTYLATGTVTLIDAGGASTFFAKLWDGVTVVASTSVTTLSPTDQRSVSLSGIFISPANNIRISVRDTTRTTGFIQSNPTGLGHLDSTVSAVRVGNQ